MKRLLLILFLSAMPVNGQVFEFFDLRGDANWDDRRDMSDVSYLLNYLYEDGPPPECFTLGDVNADQTIDISDPIALIQFLFNGCSTCMGRPDVVECPR